MSPLFFASDGKLARVVEDPMTMDEIPFIVTGRKGIASPSRKRGERSRPAQKQVRIKESDMCMERSNQNNGRSSVNSFCAVCKAKNTGMVMMCLRCGHGGHMKHIRQWFSDDVNNCNRKCAISTCSCHCVFKEEDSDFVQWIVCCRELFRLSVCRSRECFLCTGTSYAYCCCIWHTSNFSVWLHVRFS